MSKLGYWLSRGPHVTTPTVQIGSERREFDRMQIVPNEVRPDVAIEPIGVKHQSVTEPTYQTPDGIVEQLTTFYHEYIPIPWFHGDQAMTDSQRPPMGVM